MTVVTYLALPVHKYFQTTKRLVHTIITAFTLGTYFVTLTTRTNKKPKIFHISRYNFSALLHLDADVSFCETFQLVSKSLLILYQTRPPEYWNVLCEWRRLS